MVICSDWNTKYLVEAVRKLDKKSINEHLDKVINKYTPDNQLIFVCYYHNNDKKDFKNQKTTIKTIVNDYFKINSYKIINEINICEKLL